VIPEAAASERSLSSIRLLVGNVTRLAPGLAGLAAIFIPEYSPTAVLTVAAAGQTRDNHKPSSYIRFSETLTVSREMYIVGLQPLEFVIVTTLTTSLLTNDITTL
jgi:hypothetical protein